MRDGDGIIYLKKSNASVGLGRKKNNTFPFFKKKFNRQQDIFCGAAWRVATKTTQRVIVIQEKKRIVYF